MAAQGERALEALGMGREVVVAVINGRLDVGTWERIFRGQAEWLARESRRPAPETGAGQDHWRLGACTLRLP
jgi:hypothetical protein